MKAFEELNNWNDNYATNFIAPIYHNLQGRIPIVHNKSQTMIMFDFDQVEKMHR